MLAASGVASAAGATTNRCRGILRSCALVAIDFDDTLTVSE
jgi:hypothetical protein